MSSPHASSSASGRQQNRNARGWRHPSLPPANLSAALPWSGRRHRSLSISSLLQETETAGGATAPSHSLPQTRDISSLNPQYHNVRHDERYDLTSDQPVFSHLQPTNRTQSPFSPHSHPSASDDIPSPRPNSQESRIPSTHNNPLGEISSGSGGRGTGRGTLRNRDYYPTSYHQAQFDAMAAQDPTFLEHRESVGLNSLDGDLEQQPLYSMPLIIECAILGAPQQKLTLAELRTTLKKRFHYYGQEEEKGVRSWERTLLQNLSKKERFQNVERPDPGQGGYWSINHNAAPANRTRKRVRRTDPFLIKPSDRILDKNVSPISNVTAGPSQAGGSLNRPPPRSITPQSPTPTLRGLGGPGSLFPTGRSGGRDYIMLPQPPTRRPNQPLHLSSPRHWDFAPRASIVTHMSDMTHERGEPALPSPFS